MARYDHNELCRCLTLAFTPNELDQLALSRGVYPPPHQPDEPRATGDTARLLVRTLARRSELDRLVERLREERPLVQWPKPIDVQLDEPAPEPMPLASDDSAPNEPTATPDAPAAGVEVASDEVEHTELSESAEEPKPLADAKAPAGGVLDWPAGGEADDDDEERRGRLRVAALVGTAAFVVIAAVIGAFAAGRASSDEVARAPESDANPASLAGPAAAMLEQSLEAVAKTCALPDSDGSAKDVLARGFRSCASRGEDRTKRLLERRPSGAPSSPPEPTAAATAQPAGRAGAARRPAEPRPPATNCLDRCEKVHQSCIANECGEEPKSGSGYADYQRCMSGCLRKASQCRLRCG